MSSVTLHSPQKPARLNRTTAQRDQKPNATTDTTPKTNTPQANPAPPRPASPPTNSRSGRS